MLLTLEELFRVMLGPTATERAIWMAIAAEESGLAKMNASTALTSSGHEDIGTADEVLLLQVLSESISWMATAVEEFGLAVMPRPALIDWMKADLASSNAAIRNAAINFLGVCHRQMGPGLADLLRSDVKPALMTALEECFSKNPQQSVGTSRCCLTMLPVPGVIDITA